MAQTSGYIELTNAGGDQSPGLLETGSSSPPSVTQPYPVPEGCITLTVTNLAAPGENIHEVLMDTDSCILLGKLNITKDCLDKGMKSRMKEVRVRPILA